MAPADHGRVGKWLLSWLFAGNTQPHKDEANWSCHRCACVLSLTRDRCDRAIHYHQAVT